MLQLIGAHIIKNRNCFDYRNNKYSSALFYKPGIDELVYWNIIKNGNCWSATNKGKRKQIAGAGKLLTTDVIIFDLLYNSFHFIYTRVITGYYFRCISKIAA